MSGQVKIADRDYRIFHGVKIVQAKDAVDVLRRETHIPSYWLDVLEQFWAGAEALEFGLELQLSYVIEPVFMDLGLMLLEPENLILIDLATHKVLDTGDLIEFRQSDNELLAKIAQAMDVSTEDFILPFGE